MLLGFLLATGFRVDVLAGSQWLKPGERVHPRRRLDLRCCWAHAGLAGSGWWLFMKPWPAPGVDLEVVVDLEVSEQLAESTPGAGAERGVVGAAETADDRAGVRHPLALSRHRPEAEVREVRTSAIVPA